MWMIIFLLLPLLGIAYIAWHVWCLLPCAWWWKVLAIALLAGSFLTMMFGMRGLYDSMPLSVGTALYEIGTSSIFVMMYLVILFLVLDIARLCHIIPRTFLYNNWYTVFGITILMVGVFVYGNLHYQHKYRQELTLTSNRPMARPLKLVMVSDLHIGYHNPRTELHRWVDMINAEKPDLILIAGDIIDMSMRPLKEERMHEEFQRLSAPVYACLGNHEYYSGEPGAQQFYRDAGIHLLRDDVVTIGDLCIIGRDDRTNHHRKSLGKIVNENKLLKQAFDVWRQNSSFDQTREVLDKIKKTKLMRFKLKDKNKDKDSIIDKYKNKMMQVLLNIYQRQRDLILKKYFDKWRHAGNPDKDEDEPPR